MKNFFFFLGFPEKSHFQCACVCVLGVGGSGGFTKKQYQGGEFAKKRGLDSLLI